MPHWMLKATVQGGLSLLPKAHSWNRLFQKYVTRSLEMNAAIYEHKLRYCRKHIENFLVGRQNRGGSFSVLELGTGWFPIVPLGFYVCGASGIWTFDVVPLLHADGVTAIMNLFVQYAATGQLFTILPWAQEQRVAELRRILRRSGLSATKTLEQVGIYARVCDTRDTGLEPSSIDLLVSNNTLHLIPEHVLYETFAEFRRVASANAVMSHHINMGDQYATFDRSITPYNFLKYSSFVWRLFNNSLHDQNRLRLSDYRRIHQLARFEILWEENEKGSPKDLERIRIAKEFHRYSKEELLVVITWMVSTPAVAGRDGDAGALIGRAPSEQIPASTSAASRCGETP